MLRFFSSPRRPGEPISRREWLRIGGLAGFGAALASHNSSVLQAASSDTPAIPGFGRARSVILIYTSGGQSQLETWDPKPDAPLEIRGEFAAIPTAVPGTFVSEHLPRLAQLADQYAIVRSVSHDDLDHGSAGYLALTGHFHPNKSSNPPPRPIDLPTYGAVLKRVRPAGTFPYSAVHVNGPALVPEAIGPGQDAGLLGRDFDPLLLGDVSSTPIAVPCLDALPELPGVRLSARQSLVASLEELCRGAEQGGPAPDRRQRGMENAYQQAYHLLASPRSRQAFDLTAEPDAVRDRYGRHRPGQACLLARRLVEAGVPLVTVIWNQSNRGQDKEPDSTAAYGWDTHNDIFEALRGHLLPRFDATFSALLDDLDERGLLDQTLVVCMGEFGRAPQVALEKRFAGSSPGRKHWASVYSLVMAGAGIAPGTVYGASDRIAAQPHLHRVGPDDISATMFSALGIDPAGHFQDAFGRPYPISTGRPLEGLYG
ncbi:MAG: DUF1501 domain-containing protein [Planctomycetaceae bacterium]|nr:DUF1501 domain-containing protein [Planctomycetaceae bacterium]